MRTGVVLVAATLALAGCATGSSGPRFAGHELTRQTWNLAEIKQRNAWPVQLAPAQQATHQLRFSADGSLQLSLDCNRGTADWSASKPRSGSGTLQIGRIASTRALCPPPSYGEAMAADLPSAGQFTVRQGGQSLFLTTPTNEYVFLATGMATQLPGDALVPGTAYHAIGPVPCSFGNGSLASRCDAGVKRRWGEDGTTLVEIRKPDGRTRAIFFRDTTAYGTDSAQADGSASWSFRASRRGDESFITFGPEHYAIPDALVVGG